MPVVSAANHLKNSANPRDADRKGASSRKHLHPSSSPQSSPMHHEDSQKQLQMACVASKESTCAGSKASSLSHRESLRNLATIAVHSVSQAVDMDRNGAGAEPQGLLQRMVSHIAFSSFVNVMIIINLVQMGLATDNTDGDWKTLWWIADNWFTAIFLLEMVLKLAAFRFLYFKDKWNVFDALIVILSVVDTWVLTCISYLSGDGNQSSSIGPIRMFRMLRLLRMVKMFRMIPELMMVIYGIGSSLQSLFWVFGLLTLVLYVFAILSVQMIGGKDAGYPGYNSNESDIKKQYENWNNHLHFGSIPRAFVSLISMVLLAEWPTTVWPVWEYQGAVVLIFIALIVLTTFGIMNVIIGVIVEKTNAAMEDLKNEEKEQGEREQMETVKQLAQLLSDMDEDNSDSLCIAEVEEASTKKEFREFLEEINFPPGFTYADLFYMLDKDADGQLTRDEFIGAMFRIVHGNDFQHTCMQHVCFGEIKVLLREILAQFTRFNPEAKNLQETVRAEVEKVSADIRGQLTALQDQMSLLIVELRTNRQLLPTQASRTDAWGEPLEKPMQEMPTLTPTLVLGVQQCAPEPLVMAKEEKMPAVKSSVPGVLMPCIDIGGCGNICRSDAIMNDTRHLMRETVQREVQQASADVKLEIKTLRSQLMSLPPTVSYPSQLGDVRLPPSLLTSAPSSQPIHTTVDFNVPTHVGPATTNYP